ncbi:nucleoside diphosphate kinase [Martensiomyces pterosporus]|nr:nucleoside diphosphate kinase [Martensiomyces pterosporus]
MNRVVTRLQGACINVGRTHCRVLSAATANSQDVQLTLALLKPDLLANAESVDRIIREIQSTAGMEIAHRKQIFWTRKEAERFYDEHRGRFFFNRLVGYMTSGPIEAMALRGPRAIAQWREMLGATHPVRMRVLKPTTLRARYGLTDTRNSFHGSDSMESAEKELSFVFGSRVYRELMEGRAGNSE